MDGRNAKVPYQISGSKAKSNDPSTWTSFSNILRCFDPAKYDGIGFQFFRSGLVGIDIDHCIEDGQISSHAREIINQCSSYTERSPSGRGIHVIVQGTIPTDINVKGMIEMYCNSHYFTVTGDKLNDYDIEPRQDALDQLHKLHAKAVVGNIKDVAATSWRDPKQQNDDAILQRAFKSKQGLEIRALFNGDTGNYIKADGTPDYSRADFALCKYLAFWLEKDFDRIDKAFRSSKLFRADKWGREDYRIMTISRAIANCKQSRGTSPAPRSMSQ